MVSFLAASCEHICCLVVKLTRYRTPHSDSRLWMSATLAPRYSYSQYSSHSCITVTHCTWYRINTSCCSHWISTEKKHYGFILSDKGQLSRYSDWTTGWTTGVQFSVGAMMEIFFSLPPRPDLFWGPPCLLSNVYGRLPPPPGELKWQGPEADHSLPSSCPCALADHHAMKAYWGSGGIAPLILWPRH
jgi:hypothetical protein